MYFFMSGLYNVIGRDHTLRWEWWTARSQTETLEKCTTFDFDSNLQR
jgi:hypothetical protein